MIFSPFVMLRPCGRNEIWFIGRPLVPCGWKRTARVGQGYIGRATTIIPFGLGSFPPFQSFGPHLWNGQGRSTPDTEEYDIRRTLQPVKTRF